MERLRLLVFLVTLFFVAGSAPVFAQYTSSNFKANEVFFGTGGDNDLSSTNYRGSASVGNLGVGEYTSTNYRTFSGFLTPNEPFLEMGIDSTSVNLGTLSTSSTKTGSANFHVRVYVDSGYSIQITSDPPSLSSGPAHTLNGMATTAAPTLGKEEFGINLRSNTSPATFGADPDPQPSSTFATGIASSGYDTPNQYKYVMGDTVAQSVGNGWGQTNFTISYITDISNITPPGSYSMVQDLVVVPVF